MVICTCGPTFLSVPEGPRSLSQLTYRHGWATYLSSPFDEIRDGPTDTAGLNQTFSLGERSLTVGYQYGDEFEIGLGFILDALERAASLP